MLKKFKRKFLSNSLKVKAENKIKVFQVLNVFIVLRI